MSESQFQRDDSFATKSESAIADDPFLMSAGEPADEAVAPRAFQFSIAHILLWTFCAALVMGIEQTVSYMWGAQSRYAAVPTGWMLLGIAHQFVMGTILFGCVMLFVHRSQTAARVQPGEWLLIFGGAVYLAEMLSSIVRALISTETSLSFYRNVVIAQYALALGAYLLLLFLYREPGTWRRFFKWAAVLAGLSMFGTLQLTFGLPRLGQGWMWLAVAFVLIGVALFVLAVVQDMRRKTARGWLHWLGVATYSLTYGLYAITIAISLLYR